MEEARIDFMDQIGFPYTRMEEDGIITRTVYPEVPPRVEYALSGLGESMRPIITAMESFGTDYKKMMEFE